MGIVIPGAVAVLFMLIHRDWRLPLRAQPWWTLAALLVLAAPWFVLVSLRNPEFAHFFFIFEHFQRYLSSAQFDRYQPVWFFLPVLALGLLPWTSLLPVALRGAWRAARAGDRPTSLLLLWAGSAALLRAVGKPVVVFQRAKTLAIIGLTIGLLMWFVAFLSVGGEWFLMWQSHTWNGQEAAFRMFLVVGVVFLLLAMPEGD